MEDGVNGGGANVVRLILAARSKDTADGGDTDGLSVLLTQFTDALASDAVLLFGFFSVR